MLSRAERLIRESIRGRTTGKVWGGTFHAIANRLLRLHGRPLGLSPDFTVLDQADMADLMDLIRGEHLARPAESQPSESQPTLQVPSASDPLAASDQRGASDPRAATDPRAERDLRGERDPRGGRGTRDTPER